MTLPRMLPPCATPNRAARRKRALAALGLLVAVASGRVAVAAELPANIGAGTLYFESTSGFDVGAPVSTDVRISITGIVARVAVAQRFRNTGTSWAEAVYAFPLPDGAAVHALSMQVGERIIEGEIREKQDAERVYTEARDAGQRASIVTQGTPNLFTTRIANIGPGEWVDVAIEYFEAARYADGEFSLRFPMTLTPRYEPAGRGIPESLPVPDPAGSAREAAIEVSLTPGFELTELVSPHHETRQSEQDGAFALATLAPTVPMDRDFIVAWRPRTGRAPAVTTLTETIGDTTYALLMILPPTETHLPRPLPRELIYVIDTSGSMGGAPIDQAQLALASALDRLTGADRFNIVRFDSTTSSLFVEPVPATAEARMRALRYIDGLQADGGTEMEPAIRTALSQPTAPGFLRQVVFLTDGAVGDEMRLFASIKQQLGDARLFTIGIGAAPNSYFMRKAAQFGRGTYTHIGDVAGVAPAIDTLSHKLDRVALADVLVDWPQAAELYPHQVPDLYAGEPVVIAASFDAAAAGPLEAEIYGQLGGQPWSQKVTATALGNASADTSVAGEGSNGIAALWARRKIEYLMDSRVDGIDTDLIRDLVVEVGLEHGLVSAYTSLVAVDRTPARSAAAALERRGVGNPAPAGTVLAHFPSTASPARLLRGLGWAALLATAVLAWRRKVIAA